MPTSPCSAFVTVAPGRIIHCEKAADHEPADVHHGLLRVTLPDGREQAASVVWSTNLEPWDQDNLQRAE